MLEKLRARRQSEEGFTLIELMVVVLIIAILLAIAIPTFLGARSKAQDRAAQSNLRNALTAEKTFYTDQQAYSANAASDIKTIEPNLVFDASSPTAGIVLKLSASDTTNGTLCLTRTSASTKVFSIFESATNGTFYGTADLSAGGCTGTTAPAGFKATGW